MIPSCVKLLEGRSLRIGGQRPLRLRTNGEPDTLGGSSQPMRLKTPKQHCGVSTVLTVWDLCSPLIVYLRSFATVVMGIGTVLVIESKADDDCERD